MGLEAVKELLPLFQKLREKLQKEEEKGPDILENMREWVDYRRLQGRYSGCNRRMRIREVQFSSVAQSCLTLCNPMDCSTPGFPVHHQLLELTQTHVHRVSDAIQPSAFSSCLQSFPESGSFPVSQFFALGGQIIGVSASASVLPTNIQD